LPGIIEELEAVNSVRVSGGGARSVFWRELLAGILNQRVVTLETQEGSAYGAALLALAGTGAYASVAEVCGAAIRETESVSPDAADAAFYARAHRIYQSMYPAIRPICAQIAACSA
jgi:xylulokinase